MDRKQEGGRKRRAAFCVPSVGRRGYGAAENGITSLLLFPKNVLYTTAIDNLTIIGRL